MIKPKVKKILKEIQSLNNQEKVQLMFLYLLPPVGMIAFYLIFTLINIYKNKKNKKLVNNNNNETYKIVLDDNIFR